MDTKALRHGTTHLHSVNGGVQVGWWYPRGGGGKKGATCDITQAPCPQWILDTAGVAACVAR
jgi:hypothetical protein